MQSNIIQSNNYTMCYYKLHYTIMDAEGTSHEEPDV